MRLRHNAGMKPSFLAAFFVLFLPTSDPSLLTPDDKANLVEVLRLQAELGEELWPGFGQAKIPIILYNDRFEFLIGEVAPPSPWTVVAGDDFGGKPYHRRMASNPQAFAVRVGSRWAGSMTSLAEMNRKGPLKMGREAYIPFVHHEMFHAFQAVEAPEHFKAAQEAYASEARYPAKEADFIAAWDKEGGLLATALSTSDPAALPGRVREFLQAREARRAQAKLSPELLTYERELEWLEGLAKYIEDRVSDLASARKDDPRYSSYRPPFWRQADLFRLTKKLGQQDGDLRFYLSGMAQAKLLDRLSPGWKQKAMQPGVHLEDLLRAAVTAANTDR